MEKTIEKANELAGMLGEIEMDVMTNYTLADAIREGSINSTPSNYGWGDGETQCALHSAFVAAKARKYV